MTTLHITLQNSMFDIISSVGDKMSDLDINLNDPHSVSRAVNLVNSKYWQSVLIRKVFSGVLY